MDERIDGRTAGPTDIVKYRVTCYATKKNEREQGRIHGSIERWAGALMEVRSLFGLNSAVKKTRDGTTDGQTDRP